MESLYIKIYLISSMKMKKEKEFLKDVENLLEYKKLFFKLNLSFN